MFEKDLVSFQAFLFREEEMEYLTERGKGIMCCEHSFHRRINNAGLRLRLVTVYSFQVGAIMRLYYLNIN